MFVLVPPGIVLCAGVNLAIAAHHELVLDLCTEICPYGLIAFPASLPKLNHSGGWALQVVHCNASGWLCVHVSYILQAAQLRTTIVFYFPRFKKSSQGGQPKTFGSIFTFLTLIFKCVLFFFHPYKCFFTDGFLGSLTLCNTGAENGSSSQGAVGQSGPMASSTGGVSKASKGQGSAEKEEQAGNQKRARRQWESWSAEDKNSFFEGLYEVKCENHLIITIQLLGSSVLTLRTKRDLNVSNDVNIPAQIFQCVLYVDMVVKQYIH